MNEQKELKQLADECLSESIQRLHEAKLKLAEEIAIRARDIYFEINDRRGAALTLNLLSIIYDENGNESLDLQCMLDALEIAVEDNAYDISAKLYNNLGSKLLMVKSYERALVYFQLAMEQFEKAEKKGLNREQDAHPFNLIIGMNIATIYCQMGDFEKAREYYELAKAESLHPMNRDFYFTFQAFEGLFLWKIGEKDKVASLIDGIMESACKNAYTTDYMEVVADVLELLKERRDFDHWRKILLLMDEHQGDEGVHIQIEKKKRWIDFYHTIGDEEKYRENCTILYELTMLKAKQDFLVKADTIELNAEMRRAIKQKKEADSIVYLDPLTGIGNRNRMLADSRVLIEQAVATDGFISIGLVDVDYFKECNDTYGHIEGDACLKKVAAILNDAVGSLGNVYRYGGDEFLILLPNVAPDKLPEIGKTVQDNLVAAAIPNEKAPMTPYVTVSQGYTSARPEAGDDINHLVNLADRVLYSVKRAGRNGYKYMDLSEVIN